MTPVLSDQQMKEAVEKFKGILTAQGAEIINDECWGLKKDGLSNSEKINWFLRIGRVQG